MARILRYRGGQKRLVDMNSSLIADAIKCFCHELRPDGRLCAQDGPPLVISFEFPQPVIEGIQRNLRVFVNFRDGISWKLSVREISEDRLELKKFVDIRISPW
jgi:hypothetical protein